jgi:hypothetical protein
MQKREYVGTAFRQALDDKAPWLIAFVAPAEELLEWAGIPRKSDQSLIGFQRADEERRVVQAKDYFSKFNLNQSPTSLVMGIHPDLGGGTKISLELAPIAKGAPIRQCKLVVTYDEKEPLQTAIDRLKEQITARLALEDPQETEEQSDQETAEVEPSATTVEAAMEAAPEEEEDDEEEIELGRSQLLDLLKKLDDTEWAVQHEKDVRDLAKPATIIDGQHRIMGARLCERGIPFSVIAIHNCSWAEQVFQFTVVNYTHKGIPDQFITANAALSLTSGELTQLETRLQQAGVKVIEYELMRVINFDNESAFKDLVNLTSKKDDSLIGYRTMVQVGKAWYLGKDNAVRQIISHTEADVTGTKKEKARYRLQRWKNEHWGEFFKDFWRVVHDQFVNEKTLEGESLWTVGKSNLMIAVVLQSLQETFLTNLAAQDESFFEVTELDELRAKVRKRAAAFVSYFKADLFGRHWGMKSLSIGPGRQALRDLFRQVVDTKGTYFYIKHPVITGSTTSGG